MVLCHCVEVRAGIYFLAEERTFRLFSVENFSYSNGAGGGLMFSQALRGSSTCFYFANQRVVKAVLNLYAWRVFVRSVAACSVVLKPLDLDPQGRWFDPWCGHDKICTAVGPLSKALNPTLLLRGMSPA